MSVGYSTFCSTIALYRNSILVGCSIFCSTIFGVLSCGVNVRMYGVVLTRMCNQGCKLPVESTVSCSLLMDMNGV